MSLLESALKYVDFGWKILPVHNIDAGGICSCGRVDCEAPGKHPRTFQGVKDASGDPDTIRRWWSQWPAANIGLAVGPASGVFAIDVDPRHGGDQSLEEFEQMREEGPLPPTLTATTGGGGWHLFFRYPDDGPLPGRNPWLPGVDVKSAGGYVLLAPSNHISGGTYSWLSRPQPVNAPADILHSIRGGDRGGSNRPALPPARDILKGVPEGSRDDVLFRHACQLRRKGYDIEHVKVIVLEAARNCVPPFADDAAIKKVEQAWRYESDDDDMPAGVSIPGDPDDDEGAPGHRHLSDDGNAWRLLDMHGVNLRYVSAWGWMIWDGQRWLKDDTELVHSLAADVVQSIYEEARRHEDKAARKALNHWAFRSESASHLSNMVRLGRTKRPVASYAEEWDADPWLLNCANGVLDLRTGELQSHRRDILVSKITGVRYDPDAHCPRWHSFIERILPDEDVREFVRRAVGYSLSGSTREKAMFILHGSGDNGKTVFLEAIRSIMGDYASGTPSSLLVNRKPDAIPTDVARLRGARFVTASETQEGAQLASSLVKELTGGDKITARFMRQDFFEFTPEFKMWLATNHAPVITDFGDAIWRRIRLIPFEVSVPKAEQIPRDIMLEQFAQEAPGIVAWAVGGCLAWLNDGLKEPAPVMMATATYRDEMDWFGDFLDECTHRSDGATTGVNELYDAFRRWSVMRGELRPWTQNSFVRQMKTRQIQTGRTRAGHKAFVGITLKSGADIPNPGI